MTREPHTPDVECDEEIVAALRRMIAMLDDVLAEQGKVNVLRPAPRIDDLVGMDCMDGDR